MRGCGCGRRIEGICQGGVGTRRGVMVNRIKGFVRRGGRRFLVSTFTDLVGRGSGCLLLLVDSNFLLRQVRGGTVRLKVRGGVLFLKGAVRIPRCVRTVSLFMLPSLRRKLPIILVRTRTRNLPYVMSGGISTRSSVARALSFRRVSSAEG